MHTETSHITEKATAENHILSESYKPKTLTSSELLVWDELAPELIAIGRLKRHFIPAFAEYCIAVSRLRELRKRLDQEEWTYAVSGRNGDQKKMRPEVGQVNELWRQWNSLSVKFGLDPQSEKQLGQFSQDDLFDSDNPYKQWIN